jgi:hypothetical protein
VNLWCTHCAGDAPGWSPGPPAQLDGTAQSLISCLDLTAWSERWPGSRANSYMSFPSVSDVPFLPYCDGLRTGHVIAAPQVRRASRFTRTPGAGRSRMLQQLQLGVARANEDSATVLFFLTPEVHRNLQRMTVPVLVVVSIAVRHRCTWPRRSPAGLTRYRPKEPTSAPPVAGANLRRCEAGEQVCRSWIS